MGLNWSQGLNALGQGLGMLAQHSIYKDEQARRDRLDQARMQFEERRLQLAEQQAQTAQEFMIEDREFRREQFESDQQYRQERDQVEDRRFEQQQQFQQQQAEIQNNLQQQMMEIRQAQLPTETERELTAYVQAVEPIRERAWELQKELREIQGNMGLDPETQQEQQQTIERQLIRLREEEIQLQVRAGINGIDKFDEETASDIRAFMAETGASEAAVIRMIEDDVRDEQGNRVFEISMPEREGQPERQAGDRSSSSGQGYTIDNLGDAPFMQGGDSLVSRLGEASARPIESLIKSYTAFWKMMSTPIRMGEEAGVFVRSAASVPYGEFMAGRERALNDKERSGGR